MKTKSEPTKQTSEIAGPSLSDDERVELVANLILDIISEEQDELLGGYCD